MPIASSLCAHNEASFSQVRTRNRALASAAARVDTLARGATARHAAQCQGLVKLGQELELLGPLRASVSTVRGQVAALCKQVAAVEAELGLLLEADLDAQQQAWEAAQHQVHESHKQKKWAELKVVFQRLKQGQARRRLETFGSVGKKEEGML